MTYLIPSPFEGIVEACSNAGNCEFVVVQLMLLVMILFAIDGFLEKPSEQSGCDEK